MYKRYQNWNIIISLQNLPIWFLTWSVIYNLVILDNNFLKWTNPVMKYQKQLVKLLYFAVFCRILSRNHVGRPHAMFGQVVRNMLIIHLSMINWLNTHFLLSRYCNLGLIFVHLRLRQPYLITRSPTRCFYLLFRNNYALKWLCFIKFD